MPEENSPDDTESPSKDPLLESLLRLSQVEGRWATRSSVLAGLPLVDGRLNPELFVRAAKGIGLEATIVERQAEKLSPLVLPCVALFQGNQAFVVEKIHEDGAIEGYDPRLKAPRTLSSKEFSHHYSGMCIYTKSEFVPEKRLESTQLESQEHWFWGTISKSWRIYRDVLIASFLINTFVLANPLFVMNVYDRVVPNSAVETLWALAIGILVLYCFDFVLRLLRTYFIEVAGKKSDVILSSLIMEKILGAKYSKHPQSVGAFSNRVREFESIRNFITSASVSAFVDIPFVVLFLSVTAYIGGSIVWVPIIAIPLVLTYAWYVQKKLKVLVQKTFLASAQKNATLVEALSNLEAVKAFGVESKLLRQWETAVGVLAHWGVKWRIFSVSATNFASFIQQISSVFVVIIGVYEIAENTLTLGALIASVILVARAVAPFAQISGLLVQYHQAKLALDSLDEVIHTEQERPPHRKFVEHVNFSGGISISELEFSYPQEEHPVLNIASLNIKAGEKIGIIGRVGSGKSTLHKLLVGLYQADKGSILVDGIDITQIDPADLRNNIAYVPQDSVLFYGSIRDNIAYHNLSVSDKEVRRVADIAGVSEFVSTHPKGYERLIGERGEGLSGGQRQMMGIARALVNSPEIVLMDEPSAGMDNASEARLINRLKDCLKDKTFLLVTHKASMLTLVDRLIVIDRGKIVADGERNKVLAKLKKGSLNVS